MIEITPESAADESAVETLLDAAFGADRHAKRSYAYRGDVDRLWRLCMVAREGGTLIGTIRYWPIRIGEAQPAVLLGPIAVSDAYRAVGLGAALMRLSLGLAAAGGHHLVVLVGDEPYYRRFGFSAAGAYGITMEKENPDRLLARWLVPPSAGFSGGNVLKAARDLHAAA